MLINQDIALLEHRLTSTQSGSSSNLLDHMINDIDTNLNHLTAVVQTSTNDLSLENEINRLKHLKKDIIHQAIITNRKMAENLNTIIETEQKKFSLKNRFIESTSEWQQMVLNNIEKRQQHMISRTNFIIQHKLATLIH
jgi:vacuolar-type H+-ATPase subunit H